MFSVHHNLPAMRMISIYSSFVLSAIWKEKNIINYPEYKNSGTILLESVNFPLCMATFLDNL